MSYDKRALKILFDTYWEPSGWKAAAIGGKAETPPADFEYALKAGVMFHPSRLSHYGALKQIAALRNEIAPREVGEAFIASLGNTPLALRSALGGYAVALNMPSHPLSPKGASTHCEVCGIYESDSEEDLNILNFERHKWGGVRHEDPRYIAFDLDRLQSGRERLSVRRRSNVHASHFESHRGTSGGLQARRSGESRPAAFARQ